MQMKKVIIPIEMHTSENYLHVYAAGTHYTFFSLGGLVQKNNTEVNMSLVKYDFLYGWAVVCQDVTALFFSQYFASP